MAKPKATLSKMRDITSFERYPTLKRFLAEQLSVGRLSLVLGAGASMGFGLPDWDGLVNGCFSAAGLSRPVGQSCTVASETLLDTVYGRDRLKLAAAVRDALYPPTVDLSLSSLRRSDLLAAVGALTMVSSRGHVGKVVSFNFDDVLETFLRYFGYSVGSISSVPYWQQQQDVVVFHPHGILPHDKSAAIEAPIIFTQLDYDEIVGKASDIWRNVLLDVFRTHTCIFIGLSGEDDNLTSVLAEVKKSHVSQKRGDLFWGVRFSDNPLDPNKSKWQLRGVFQYTLSSYSELPNVIFEVCQIAAEMRKI